MNGYSEFNDEHTNWIILVVNYTIQHSTFNSKSFNIIHSNNLLVELEIFVHF